MKIMEIIPHTLPSVYRLLLLTFRKLIELFVQFLSSAVNHSDHMLPFWWAGVLLLSSKKVIGFQCIQVPFSNCPIILGSIPLNISRLWFILKYLSELLRMNLSLSWYFSEIVFSYGSTVSTFCGISTFMEYFFNSFKSTAGFPPFDSYPPVFHVW